MNYYNGRKIQLKKINEEEKLQKIVTLNKEILFFPLEIKLFDGVLFIVKVADECIISFITHFKANEKLLKIQLIISL